MDSSISTVLPLVGSAGRSTLAFRTRRSLKVFVTGANGFIGSVVVRMLHAAGHTVRVLVRPNAHTERIDRAPRRTRGGRRAATAACLRRAVEGQHAVIHLAGLSSWDLIDSPEMGETTGRGTAGVLAAALRHARDARGLRLQHPRRSAARSLRSWSTRRCPIASTPKSS